MAVSTLPAHAIPTEAVFASEADLIAAAVRDPSAFAAIYRAYVNGVYQYCYRRLGQRESAEDATSQVFTQALAKLRQFRGEEVRPWIFGIAHNVVVDMLRRHRPTAPIELADRLPSAASGPETQAVVHDEQTRLLQALATLPGRERQIVELRLAGLTGAEIAAALRCSHGSVRVAHHRAVQRLRAALQQEEM